MVCSKCEKLHTLIPIRKSSDLERAIAMVKTKIEDGTITAVEQQSDDSLPSFSELLKTTVRDDFLYYLFKCNFCAQGFQLYAETYHGAGGAWRPMTD